MKITNLFFLLGLLLLASCKKDDTNPSGTTTLQYDNGNVSGPQLDAGEHELAVRFPASTLADLVGKKLTEVQVFVGELPQSCIVKIYKQGNSSTPGAQILQSDVLNSIEFPKWNNFKITPGIEITGEDLWVSVYIELAGKQQSIGCDSGPRKTNGDWLFSGSDHAWKTYQERTGESINWNIRAVVE
ncbi:MAG: hypothetical protein GC192_06630 [Bacteroidetes bacterium]|nr:hypothetical protein [Bacteroidota bacterium]